MKLLYTPLLALLHLSGLTSAKWSTKHFPTTAPEVINFLLRPHRFPLSTYSHPWSFQHHDDIANLTVLRDELFFYDSRVRRNGGDTIREFNKGMKRVIRVPKYKGWCRGGGAKSGRERGEVERLLGGGKVGRVGGWVGDVTLGGGDGQRIEFALDMLSSDFVVYSTTVGGAFERLLSETYFSTYTHVTNTCIHSSDHLSIPHHPSSPSFPFYPAITPGSNFTTLRIPFTHCIAHHATHSTRLPSGAVWGLAYPSLSQSTQPSLLHLLHTTTPLFKESSNEVVLQRPIWSFATVSPTEAILTLGGTVTEFAPEKEWKWTSLKDQVEGYWEVNIQSVLVGRVRVLRTVPKVIIDVSSALIMGPGEMVEVIWGFVEGARRLWELEMEWEGPDMDKVAEGGWWGERDGGMGEWWVYPCLNEPLIQLEFAGWGFPVERIGLGKVREGSGYCVGSIVGWPRHRKTKFDRKNEVKHEQEDGEEDEKRVWILGQPFWSGVVGVFDLEKKMVGMRTP